MGDARSAMEAKGLRSFDGSDVESTYSNFDGIPPRGAEKALREGKVYLAHPAMDHWGAMWFEDGKFHEMVMRYGTHVATITGDSLKEVFDAVNDQFGWA